MRWLMRHLIRGISLALVLVALASHAQTFRGSINGTVTDPAGAVVPKAQVKATETATSADHNTVTTSDGQFAIQDIPLGLYKVTVNAPGFATTTIDNVQVVAGQIYTLTVRLTVAKESQSVEVSAAALTLDTTTQTQTNTLE